jgi:hypothetical protein
VRIGGITQAFVTHIAAYAVKVEIGNRGCSGAALGELASVEIEVYEEGVSGIEGARNIEFQSFDHVGGCEAAVYGSTLGAGNDSRKGRAARADPEGDGVRVNAVVSGSIVHTGRPGDYVQVYLNIFCWSETNIFDAETPLIGLCWSVSITATLPNEGKSIVI